jgi:twitching motility protein PilI
MANTLDLRQYQQEILSRMGAVARGGNKGQSRLGVLIGTEQVLVDMSQIAEVLPLPEIFPVPLTKSWFMGVANIRGNLYGISDLHYFFHGSTAVKTPDKRVLLVNPDIATNVGLVVDRLLGLRDISGMKQKKSKKSGIEACFPAQYQDQTGGVWKLLDCVAIANSREFVQLA